MSQRELISTFADQYFNCIEDCVDKRAHSLTNYIYLCLAPNLCATDEEIARFTDLKNRLEAYSEAEKKAGSSRLLKWVKESI